MSELKTALQFQGLDRLREQLAGQGPAARERKLADNEKAYTRWLMAAFPGEPQLETLAAWARGCARSQANPNLAMIEEVLPVGSGWRRQSLPPLTSHHRFLPAADVRGALERLFEWTAEEAFLQLHPVERAALALARLLEIGPFARLNVPLAATFSCLWLLRGGFVFPVWEHPQPGKYQEYLDAAFRLEMQPLVDHLLRGERQALQALVR